MAIYNIFALLKVAKSRKGFTLSQRKYVLDMFSEAGMFICQPVNALVDLNSKANAK